MKALIVIDMQNDFIDGSLGTPEARAIVPKVCNKIEKFDGDIIYCTRDTHFADYLNSHEGKNLPVEHCIGGTEGWDICPEVQAALDNLDDKRVGFEVFNKLTFGYNGWDETLLNARTNLDITLVGLCTDICVVSNALILRALYPEADIKVDASCCAGVTPATHEAALKVMEMNHIEVINK